MPKAHIIDSWAGIRTGLWKDRGTGKMVVVNDQQCDRILVNNKYDQGESKPPESMGGRLLARIPVLEFTSMLDSDGMNMQTWGAMTWPERRKWLAKKLNDPDYKYLKTTTKPIFARR